MNIVIILSFLFLFSSLFSQNNATFEGISRQNCMKEFKELGNNLKLLTNRKVDNDKEMIIVKDRIEKCQKIFSKLKKEGEECLIDNSVTLIQGILYCATYLHSALLKYFKEGKKVKDHVENDYIFLLSKLEKAGLNELKKEIVNELELENLNEKELEKIIGKEMAEGNIQLIKDKLIYCKINQNNLEMVKFGEALQFVGEVINFYFEKERFLPTEIDIPFLEEIKELGDEIMKEKDRIEEKINEEKLVDQIEEMKLEINVKDIKMSEANSENNKLFNLAELAINAYNSLLKFILSPIEVENEKEYLEREIMLKNNFNLFFENLNYFGFRIINNKLIQINKQKNNKLFKLISKLFDFFFKNNGNIQINIKKTQRTWKRKELIKKFAKIGESSTNLLKRKRNELLIKENQKTKKRITANDYLKQREKVFNNFKK